MEYGIYEIMTDKIGHGMVEDYRRFAIKRNLAPDEEKAFYQRILNDLNAEFKRRFNFDWEANGF